MISNTVVCCLVVLNQKLLQISGEEMFHVKKVCSGMWSMASCLKIEELVFQFELQDPLGHFVLGQ